MPEKLSQEQTRRFEILDQLVEELSKTEPAEEKVKEFMAAAGMNYIEDPIERLKLVLEVLHFEEGSVEQGGSNEEGLEN